MRLKKKINELLHPLSNVRKLLNEFKSDFFNLQNGLASKEFIRTQYLQEKVLNSRELGISSNKVCEYEVVVSLTTHGVRIYDVYLAIESIMQGTVKPNRLVLWLSEDEFNDNDLPVTLKNQISRGLEVLFCKDVRSFTKLIPSLRKFPESCIITIDDDIIYDFDLVERLVTSHKLNPDKVCSNRIHKMKLGDDYMPISYMKWDWCVNDYSIDKLNFLTGVGGVLYPPHVFTQEVFNESVFLDICKYADDVWFNAMLLLNNVDIIKSYTRSTIGEDYLGIEGVQYLGLCYANTNETDCRNDVQIRDVWEMYKINQLLQDKMHKSLL